MQFSSSLKFNHIFRRLYRKGQSAANGYLVLYCRKNGSQANRIGLTVSAKLAHAVQRNRLRRQLREIYRLHEASFVPGYDLVVVARSRAIGADYAVLEHAYLSLAARLGRCRFSPTCSQYALEAITKYGALKGGWLALKRLLRCNPFYKGDYFDPVP